jgi:hypothetical protein
MVRFTTCMLGRGNLLFARDEVSIGSGASIPPAASSSMPSRLRTRNRSDASRRPRPPTWIARWRRAALGVRSGAPGRQGVATRGKHLRQLPAVLLPRVRGDRRVADRGDGCASRLYRGCRRSEAGPAGRMSLRLAVTGGDAPGPTARHHESSVRCEKRCVRSAWR